MCYLREAVASDMELYLTWVNDSAVRAASFCSEPIERAEHESWFARALSDTRNRMYVLIGGGKPLGQVRLTKDAAGAYTIDYSVDRAARGRGYGRLLLELVEAKVAPGTRLIGEVRAGNVASLAVFTALGYAREDRADRVVFTRVT